ncbi:response regulator [Natronomonas sp.]|uniref:response regulator n=2 Tax=Natronomonas sp. TaxID=2184060 RepID=UPI002FC291D4
MDGDSIDAERVETSREVLRRLDAGEVDCVVCEYDLGGGDEETGLDVLRAVRERNESVPFLLYTERTDGDVAIEATRLGVTESFTDDERNFIELLVEWLGHEIVREDPPRDGRNGQRHGADRRPTVLVGRLRDRSRRHRRGGPCRSLGDLP